MSVIAFRKLCAIAAIAVFLAVVAIMQQPDVGSPDQEGEAVFPNLLVDLDRLKSVVIQERTDTISLDWAGSIWAVRESAGFPADEDKVAQLVIGLAQLVKVEPKTRLPDRYARLNLGDPETPESKGKQVRLIDVNGKEIASLIIGKRKYTLGGDEVGTYIREPGDPQTWLARGEITATATPRDWLQRVVTDIEESQIQRVTVIHPDGEKIIAAKEMPGDEIFLIKNLPRRAQLSSAYTADQYGRILSDLQLDDAASAEEVSFPPEKTVSVTVEGFGGFRVVLDVAKVDGKDWLRIATAEVQSRGGEESERWAARMADISKRSHGRVFQVPAYEVATMKQRMADLLKKDGPSS